MTDVLLCAPSRQKIRATAAALWLGTFPSLIQGQTQLGPDLQGEAADDLAGYSIALSENGARVAIGATSNDGAGTDAGHVRVYESTMGNWIQLGSDIEGAAAHDQSGWSVALAAGGERVAIGAIGSGATGQVRVYELSMGDWAQLGSDIDGEAAGDLAGWSLALSADGNRVAVGAHGNGGNGTQSGHVRVYEYNAGLGAWVQIASDIDGEAAEDRSGWSVALSADGNRVAIGAPFNDDAGLDAGHVRVFQLTMGQWIQVGADIDGEAGGDRSGQSVSLSADGSRVAIGASNNDGAASNAGHVRVYERRMGVWTQVGSDIDGERANDLSGYSVSLSAAGDFIVIGAPFHQTGGLSTGHARLYQLTMGDWAQVGTDILGDADGDLLGFSVSFSGDGSRVAVGATQTSGSGNEGYVRVFADPLPVELEQFAVE